MNIFSFFLVILLSTSAVFASVEDCGKQKQYKQDLLDDIKIIKQTLTEKNELLSVMQKDLSSSSQDTRERQITEIRIEDTQKEITHIENITLKVKESFLRTTEAMIRVKCGENATENNNRNYSEMLACLDKKLFSNNDYDGEFWISSATFSNIVENCMGIEYGKVLDASFDSHFEINCLQGVMSGTEILPADFSSKVLQQCW
ncbi:MAG: hypothetical protein A2504_14535 [Bdellovibrionales bacterium RIFOXYD12_FULL_39_22]|nr:MAG: hypothetical protein A2385_04020 [Bdellovibrionales bacterium RIFOXYB1_FULL_39_21]OFZ43497.1 MAG: hypothetical protein A2485_13485 [Bdellovibrionales bacterium RIFOXYC12_FULL_39_17]OFZ48970.1 MAG: hypothetical protein A2404_08675 [Bdellovibrionales bacterium RIFOXYC1_FULL_39_130]OFZ73369.1 MAG: hypothetical protein A2451_04505 [Bdellovibrionales bacterium RIFOXYC2_FULL_39_8]OFZ76237.1 MAG: hypothetical protein A2560_07795 [Bdellovibrionales bacterium RIFOXYD1_FULL_39_84]OFZ94472.1 MAG: